MEPEAPELNLSFEELATIISHAIADLKMIDGADLQVTDFGERVLTCRLAFLLAERVEKRSPFCDHQIKVDCEYNRNLLGPKRVGQTSKGRFARLVRSVGEELLTKKPHSYSRLEHLSKKVVSQQQANPSAPFTVEDFVASVAMWGELAGSLLFPDIIVHKRGTHRYNLLVIEAKKADTTHGAIEHDRRKLEYYTTSDSQIDDDSKAGINYRFGLFLQFSNDATLIAAEKFERGESQGSVMDQLCIKGV